MPRYVIYRRVSTRDQGKNGYGLDAQESDIKIFLKNYSDDPYEVIAEFIEVQSGGDNDRPKLAEAIALAKAEKATLLVAKLDRLSRRVSFIAGLMDEKRLNFKVAQMPHADKFQLHIYAALAEQERDFISKRTEAALAVKRQRGEKTGGSRPFGAVKVVGADGVIRLAPHAEEVAAYHEIVRLDGKGRSAPQIVELLDVEVSENTVRRLLKRGLPVYAG